MIKKKWFLYCTEFFAGMSVMAVELAASRLLTPYFSSSQIIWTILIGTIMIAMALGNLIGGRLADRKPNPHRLFFCLLISALWIALIPFLGKWIIGGISIVLALFVEANFLPIAAFVCCMIIFVFPLLLLGMVTPTLAKYSIDNMDQNAKIVGELGALNTIGSILGTFLPTFVVIPNVGTNATFLIFSSILFLISAVYFISLKKKIVTTSLTGLIIIGLFLSSSQIYFAVSKNEVLYEGESMYNYLQVKENSSQIIFTTNVLFGVQSVKQKTSIDRLTGFYYDYAVASAYMAKLDAIQNPEILILGLGTGTICQKFLYLVPGANIDAVEIDNRIVDLAYEYFDLDTRVNVKIDDGRSFMNRTKKTYDLIMVDAYQDITIPFQMSSVEFFTLIKDHLTEGGVVLLNLNMYSTKPGTINEYLLDTVSSVFKCVYPVKVQAGSNCEVFISDNENMMSDFIASYPTEAPSVYQSHFNWIEATQVKYVGGPNILTDDKAPVELLGMSVIDELINKELSYYRSLFKGKSLKEMFDMLKNM